MGVKVFVINKTGFTHRYLRRYIHSTEDNCTHPENYGYHNANVFLDKGVLGEPGTTVRADLDKTDTKWPKTCKCGYEFKESDQWQLFIQTEYAMDASGEHVCTINTAPPGAMWDADWYERKGPDGHRWIVKLPNGHDWDISSRASNCGSPCKICSVPYREHDSEKQGHGYEDSNPHECWVQHGSPTNHVDKNGNTCVAGAGSIASGEPGKMDYFHGYFHNGEIVDC